MPRYRFEFPDEPDGLPLILELSDDDHARREAIRACAESLIDGANMSGSVRPDSIDVFSEDSGQLITSIKLPKD